MPSNNQHRSPVIFKPLVKTKEIAKTKKNTLRRPPRRIDAGYNTLLPEGTPAVLVKASKARTCGIQTKIFTQYDNLLDALILKLKKKEGRKPTIAEVIERGLEALDQIT